MPPVRRFVVKNGSKIRSTDVGLDAGPSSLTAAISELALVADVDADRPAVRHRLARVRDQVEEDLLELVRAARDGRAGVVVGVDELDALVRVRAPDEIDRGADDVFERHDMTLFGVLAREVEERADDLLDLEARLLDQLEPLARFRARLGLLEEELRQAEDREQRVVDLVRDAGGELADRRELAALDELLVEPRFSDMSVMTPSRSAVSPSSPGTPCDRISTGSGRPSFRRKMRSTTVPAANPSSVLVRRPTTGTAGLPDDLVAREAREVEKAWFTVDQRARLRVADGDRDRHRVEERVEVLLVQHRLAMLRGDVAEDDDRAAGRGRHAAVEHELAAVEGRRANAEPPALPGLARRVARHLVAAELERLTVERPRVEHRAPEVESLVIRQREHGARRSVWTSTRRRADDDAVGDAVEHELELKAIALAERALCKRRQPGERLEQLGRVLGLFGVELALPCRVDRVVAVFAGRAARGRPCAPRPLASAASAPTCSSQSVTTTRSAPTRERPPSLRIWNASASVVASLTANAVSISSR